jgi:hypothetical protein
MFAVAHQTQNDWLLATVWRNDGDPNAGADASSQSKCYGLVVQVSAKDCERKAINANLCLVVAALLVTGAHHRTIEQFISIILISLSVLGWWIAGRECQRFG